MPDRVAPGLFPPELVVQVKALACELPAQHEAPLSRWSLDELARHVCQSGLVAHLSQTTLWRWLHEDAIRPWQHRCWIFPRDPDFAAKAGRILDLYERRWEGKPLQDDEFVFSADEKTSVQARRRVHPTLPPQPGRPMKVEHEYERLGAWAYLAAMDVHGPKLFGRCEATSGIEPFDRLVAQAMAQEPYQLGPAGVLDYGQWFFSSRPTKCRTPAESLPQSPGGPRPYPRQLAQPDRNLLLHYPTKGAHTK